MIVFGALALKLVIVLAAARALRARCPDALGALLAAWVIVTATAFAMVFALSAAEALTRAVLWVVLGAGALAAAFCLRGPFALPAFVREAPLVLALFGVFWLAFALRALLFQDFTWDAQTHGLLRIGLWIHYQSVFVHMPTPLVNVFANDWNGELLGLLYGLCAGDLQGPLFANVEVLLFSFFACAWLAWLLSASWAWAFTVAALTILCPVCLGIATTTKGDLLAVGALINGVGWLLVLRSQRTSFAGVLFVACLALAAGAKIMTLIAVGVLGAFGLSFLGIRFFLKLRFLCVILAISFVFLVRYLLNVLEYGDPFHRPPGEGPVPSFVTFLGNLEVIWRSSYSFAINVPGSVAYASHLSGGFGITGVALIGAIILVIARGQRLPLGIMACLIIGLMLSCYSIPPRIYGLRYFAPTLLAIVVIVLSGANVRRKGALLVLGLMLSAANISYLAQPGELNGNGTLARALAELPARREPMEKLFLADEQRRKMVRYDDLRLDRKDSLTIVMFHDLDNLAAPFVGSRAQHRLILVGSMADVPLAAREKKADYAVITKRGGRPLPDDVLRAVSASGFVWIEKNRWMEIAVRVDLPEASLR